MARRPRFGQWLGIIWLDLVTMVAMGVLGLGVSFVTKPFHFPTLPTLPPRTTLTFNKL
jgi:hypothetical protein